MTSREAFVKYTKLIVHIAKSIEERLPSTSACLRDDLRKLAVAFADKQDEAAGNWCEHDGEPQHKPCKKCRADLLRDCGLEETP